MLDWIVFYENVNFILQKKVSVVEKMEELQKKVSEDLTLLEKSVIVEEPPVE